MRFDLDSLGPDPLAPASQVAAEGKPAQLPIECVEEDPDQPRTEFGDEAFKDLCESIAARGVITPLSVRVHPATPGRWIINHGARRWRASRHVGKATVPAFIDEPADDYEQVIENEQREPLSAMDLALFIKRRLAMGENQSEIARSLHKSRQYVLVASALIDAPEWLEALYREGRCRGRNELHELRKLAADHRDQVMAWAQGQPVIARDAIQRLKESLAADAVECSAGNAGEAGHPSPQEPPPEVPGATAARRRQAAPKPRVLVATFGGASVVVVTRSQPTEPRHVYVVRQGSQKLEAVAAEGLQLQGWMPADACHSE